MQRHILLPISLSHTIRRQLHVSQLRTLKALNTPNTSQRKWLSTTNAVYKRISKVNGFGSGDLDELVESGKLSSEAQTAPPQLSLSSKPIKKPTLYKDPQPATPNFDLQIYHKTWSPTSLQPILSLHDLTLLDYLSQLVESPASLDVLALLDHHEALDFKKRWIAFELDPANPAAHFPLLDFFLERGLKFLPPVKGRMEVGGRIEKIDPPRESRKWEMPRKMLEELKGEPLEYPDLMTPDALLDPKDVLDLPASSSSPFHNRVIVRNHRSIFHKYAEGEEEDELLAEDELAVDENQDQDEMMRSLPVPSKYYKDLHQSILMRRGVVQQTGKGKIRRVSYMVLVGDGNGLVGYGEGKHSNGSTALKAARLAAVKNMDYVERFEKRTIWTEMSTKLGATRIMLRPRPVGFGLRCNPHLHRILRAAGLKDVSAKVWGSRNKLNVIKAAFRILHGGHAPTGMGDGLGGKGKKLMKGGGLRNKSEIERARGRKLINLRK